VVDCIVDAAWRRGRAEVPAALVVGDGLRRTSRVRPRLIAKNLAVTQPEVSRIVKRLRLNPAARDRSPREVLLEHAARRIDHDRMMAELLAWDYTFGHVADDDPLGESYVRGRWDQVERSRDLLGDDDYRVLLAATADRRAQANAL
jgi:hypothetical protein